MLIPNYVHHAGALSVGPVEVGLSTLTMDHCVWIIGAPRQPQARGSITLQADLVSLGENVGRIVLVHLLPYTSGILTGTCDDWAKPLIHKLEAAGRLPGHTEAQRWVCFDANNLTGILMHTLTGPWPGQEAQ